MPTPIILKLDVTKLRKEWFFKGAKGTYCDLVIYENDRESPYGDTHVAKQSPSKEARAAGEKPIICANGKWMPQKGSQQQPRQAPRHQHGSVPAKQHPLMKDDGFDGESIPF